MAKRRDIFTHSVIEKLRTRVANKCSNPSHRVQTTGPSTKDFKTVNSIGIAAHICAASPGGPRYDPEMTPTERKSIENAIWLCSNCSIEIDRDENKYSVSLLKQWKAEAELLASQELGKRLPDNDEIIETLTTALTGHSNKVLDNAIPNYPNCGD